MVSRCGLRPLCKATSFMTCQAKRRETINNTGWTADKNMTLPYHRPFSPAPCPGDQKMYMIVACGTRWQPFLGKHFPTRRQSHRCLRMCIRNAKRGLKLDVRNGNKKPKVPMEKLSTGGTAPILKREDAWRIVPSPPSVTTRSIGAAPSPRRLQVSV